MPVESGIMAAEPPDPPAVVHTLCTLQPDLLELILALLDGASLSMIGATCLQLRAQSESSFLWENLLRSIGVTQAGLSQFCDVSVNGNGDDLVGDDSYWVLESSDDDDDESAATPSAHGAAVAAATPADSKARVPTASCATSTLERPPSNLLMRPR